MIKHDVIRKIKLIQGVWMIINHFGSSMRVVLYFGHEASLKKQIELITEISNCDDLLYREIHFPRCTIGLTEHDLTLKESALQLGYVSEAEFDRIVDPLKMVRPYVAS